MKFSTKTRYGIRAMLEIASSESPKGINQKDISANQDISYKYLDQIIHALKVAKLITKAQGFKSGYTLSRKPEDITMLDVHNAFEPHVCVIDCLSGTFTCERSGSCASKGFWGGLNQLIIDYFKSITVWDLMQDHSKLEGMLRQK
ncbi:MAG: Rrf2 family transcriptional regulator [Bacteroidales bacterium]|nr:Rrf2 family transcriptional regulator [Bacteroidales bacterium]